MEGCLDGTLNAKHKKNSSNNNKTVMAITKTKTETKNEMLKKPLQINSKVIQ